MAIEITSDTAAFFVVVDSLFLIEEEIAVRRTANGLGESFFGLARYLPRRKS
jgi:hypothetical protein